MAGLVVGGAVLGGAAVELWRRDRLPAPTTAQTGAPPADLQRLSMLVPSQSHAMIDVGYHWTNLWFAAEQKNWRLAEFYFNEARSHMQWTILIRPIRKDDQNRDVDLQAIFDALDVSSFAGVKMAIAQKDSAKFARRIQAGARRLLHVSQSVGDAVPPSDDADGAGAGDSRLRSAP